MPEPRSDIANIDHVGVAVRDMDRAAAVCAALGFQLTPLSAHKGAWKPGDPLTPLGSANRCAMFADNYLELLVHVDPLRPDPRQARFLAHHQGAHIVCFGTDDPQAVDRRLVAAGVGTSGVIPLQRDVDTPDGVRTARFERVQFDPRGTPEGYIQAARHLTPEYLHQPRYMRHPNQVTGLSEALIVADDAELCAARYARYTGRPCVRDGARHTFVLQPACRLSIVATGDAAAVLPGSLLPPSPAIAGVVFQTADLGAMRRRLEAAGIAFAEAAGRLAVPAEEACGTVMIFESATP